ncbi:polysaccharide synthesis protein GtrA [Helicobacter sp. 16-1353]|uniref:GtrA family protein n=1 Tax=Helicobacter sp. 16-1353 TaxID=2004996 RepID=UPI000DCBDDD2|nr:GtrA family protein [Helicobacter sp. 16-1353]RAX51809.1 polysaccharide synthesis protein GtrA [Helicobacter sp. 16-1353]
MKILKYSFIKYLIVGIINTLFGFGIIFILMYYGLLPEIANFIGYLCGIILSFILNKYFTFKSNNHIRKEFFRFLISMGIAYAINLIILIISYRYFLINEYVSQIIAGVFYTLSGYILSKLYAFRNKS